MIGNLFDNELKVKSDSFKKLTQMVHGRHVADSSPLRGGLHPPKRSRLVTEHLGLHSVFFCGRSSCRRSHKAEAHGVVAAAWTASLSAESRLAGTHVGVPGAAADGVDRLPPFRTVRGGYG